MKLFIVAFIIVLVIIIAGFCFFCRAWKGMMRFDNPGDE